MARKHFLEAEDDTTALTDCTKFLFQKLVHGATWSLGAFQSLSDIPWDDLPSEQREELQTVPAMVYYGVDSVEGVLMRSLHVPRSIAKAAGSRFLKDASPDKSRSTATARDWLLNLRATDWEDLRRAGMRTSGEDLQTIWRVLNGFDSGRS